MRAAALTVHLCAVHLNMTVVRVFGFPVEEGFQLQVCVPPARNCAVGCHGYMTVTSRLQRCCMLLTF